MMLDCGLITRACIWRAEQVNSRRFEKISNKMSAGGARPGAGRKAGKPNRLTEQRVEQARREGKRLPPESLLLIAENSMAMAERYQPELTDPTTREKSPNPLHNEERYAFWLAASREAYKAAAPYYAPKLHAIACAPMQTTEQKAVVRDPRDVMLDELAEMNRRGELARLVNPKPEPVIDATADNVVALRSSIPTPAASASAPAPMTEAEKQARVAALNADKTEYSRQGLRRQTYDEPWRPFVGPDGISTRRSPWDI